MLTTASSRRTETTVSIPNPCRFILLKGMLLAMFVIVAIICFTPADKAFALTSGWTQCGTCEWQVTNLSSRYSRMLTIRPIDNGLEGTLDSMSGESSDVPWNSQAAYISNVNIIGTIHAGENCSYLFALGNATFNGLENLNVSSTTNMHCMFDNCRELTDLSSLSSWDISKVTDMSEMFQYCNQLTDLNPLSSWNTSNVTNMYKVFSYCTSLTSLSGLDKWDVSKVTDMSALFGECWLINDISSISNWNTSNVESLNSIFWENNALRDLSPISNWNISKVSDMRYMFFDCYSLVDISPLSSWNTSNLNYMDSMFYNCSSLKDASFLSGWNTENVISMGYMFNSCSSLKIIDISGWDVSKVVDMEGMFEYCESLETIYAAADTDWSQEEIREGYNMFDECAALVGGNGTVYDQEHNDISYALVDGFDGRPGYFTAKIPSVQTGRGITDLTLVMKDSSERGGTSEPKVIPAIDDIDPGELVDENGNPNPNGKYILNPYYNPDENDDGLGDNLQFSIPSSLNFVVMGNGAMRGPEAYIENHSVIPIHASSLKVIEIAGWNIVEDAMLSASNNSVTIFIGPEGHLINLNTFKNTKSELSEPWYWNMNPADSTVGSGDDALNFGSFGHAAHITADISSPQKFGEIHWYMTPGRVSA